MFHSICILILIFLCFFPGAGHFGALVKTATDVLIPSSTYGRVLVVVLNFVFLDQLIAATTNKRRIVVGFTISLQGPEHQFHRWHTFHKIPGGGIAIFDLRTSIPGLGAAGRQVAISFSSNSRLLAVAYYLSARALFVRYRTAVACVTRRSVRALKRYMTEFILAGEGWLGVLWKGFVRLSGKLGSIVFAVFIEPLEAVCQDLDEAVAGTALVTLCKPPAVLPQDDPFEDPGEEDVSSTTLVNEIEDKEEVQEQDAVESDDKAKACSLSAFSSQRVVASSSEPALGAFAGSVLPHCALLSPSISAPACLSRLSAPLTATLSISAPPFVPSPSPTTLPHAPVLEFASLVSSPIGRSNSWTPSKPPPFWSPGGCKIRIVAPPPPTLLRASAASFAPRVAILHVVPPKMRPSAPTFWSPGGVSSDQESISRPLFSSLDLIMSIFTCHTRTSAPSSASAPSHHPTRAQIKEPDDETCRRIGDAQADDAPRHPQQDLSPSDAARRDLDVGRAL
ncbi:hypothetical protein C8J57DRAFT_1711532 [Mycena rebaudengoi]|nr:hypothetical protein C8J57DRAFT_1711532 [Mycena rebaudengoi]